jgi:hypothetical protein
MLKMPLNCSVNVGDYPSARIKLNLTFKSWWILAVILLLGAVLLLLLAIPPSNEAVAPLTTTAWCSLCS